MTLFLFKSDHRLASRAAQPFVLKIRADSCRRSAEMCGYGNMDCHSGGRYDAVILVSLVIGVKIV